MNKKTVLLFIVTLLGACIAQDDDASLCAAVLCQQCTRCGVREEPCDTPPCPRVPYCYPLEYAPVCGTDARTYENVCVLHTQGVEYAHDGYCTDEEICAAANCTEGYICETQVVQCIRAPCPKIANCVERPKACPLHYAPVCGVDGTTYDNLCLLRASGVAFAHHGPCAERDVCATVRCPSWTRCVAQQEKCDAPPCHIRAVCEPIACPLIYAPVCGVDGETYGNMCELSASQAEYAYDGACTQPPTMPADVCATVRCRSCTRCVAQDIQCDTPPCGQRAVCEQIGCPKIYRPVCGVDGETYSNDCVLCTAQVALAHEGPCDICDGVTCGPWTRCIARESQCDSPPCPTEPFCDRIMCPEYWDPVCGVDGQTYGNACKLSASQVEQAHPGAC